ncbi:MAG: hypothetical protein H6581_25085 [Bacteroidia bacterium]|nr:hypothetical protein [Bacteroidia bacterium]
MIKSSNVSRLQIHPAIGVARVGDSPDSFYISPETTGGLPIQCDCEGNAIIDPVTLAEKTVTSYKDKEGRVKRQAARFGVFVIGKDGKGTPLKIGDTIETLTGPGTVTDIKWTTYVANKKAVWYEFKQLEGEHGYAPDHPLRNAKITDSEARQKLIIDPGPRVVNAASEPRRATFARNSATTGVTENFPPPDLKPFPIDTLGEVMTDQNGRLIVLGGHGCSGSMGTNFSDPKIKNYANNDNWFDDVSDGPVMAIIHYFDKTDNQVRMMDVEDPAWVVVGYPRYAPPIVDLVTMDDLLHDLNIREFATHLHMYGVGHFDDPKPVNIEDKKELNFWRDQPKWWNTDYYPDFNTEIFPILTRPFNYQWVTNFLNISFPAHEVNYRGDFDMSKISHPPIRPLTDEEAAAQIKALMSKMHKGVDKPGKYTTSSDPADPTDIRDKTTPLDPYRYMRQFIFQSLRGPGEENVLRREYGRINNPLWYKELMPLLCGDNPLTNTLPSKFFRLTDTQLFLIHQWAVGKFRNDNPITECTQQAFPFGQQYITDQSLTQGVLGNVLGGSFCPGAEMAWIMRNPAIFSKPYRIKANPAFVPTSGAGVVGANNPFIQAGLSQSENLYIGLEPGDLTKRSAVPWQADFNECSTQDVDVTFESWCKIYPDNPPDPTVARNQVNITMWWPTHRPLQVYLKDGTQIEWAAYIPQTHDGDLKMVSAWKEFGFVIRNPDPKAANAYYEIERNPAWIPKTDN